MAGSNWLADFIVFPLVLLGLKIAPNTLMKPLGKLTWWGMQQSPPPYVTALQVNVKGETSTKDGKVVDVQVRLEHKDSYEMTVIPVVACLLQYLDGTLPKSGLHLMGQVVEPQRLMRDMERMGFRLVEQTSETAI